MTFNINLCSIKESYFWFPRLSEVTMATSWLRITRDFLKLTFLMFPYNEILKVKSELIFDKGTPNTSNFSEISQGLWELRASEI